MASHTLYAGHLFYVGLSIARTLRLPSARPREMGVSGQECQYNIFSNLTSCPSAIGEQRYE